MKYQEQRHRSLVWLVILAASATAPLTACQGDDEPYRSVPGGNVDRGKQQVVAYGCGSCHTIPGIDRAHGLVGPPLNQFARRVYIAGEVPNNARYLVQWIEVPQSIEPGTAMPNLGVTEGQARDIAAYLYTLK
jgi:cytochrome c